MPYPAYIFAYRLRGSTENLNVLSCLEKYRNETSRIAALKGALNFCRAYISRIMKPTHGSPIEMMAFESEQAVRDIVVIPRGEGAIKSQGRI